MSDRRDHLAAAPPPGRNVHGRRWGRGVRPYLLVLKIAGAAMFLGGLATVLTMLTAFVPADVQDWRARAELIRLSYTRVIVPGLTAAALAGVLLAASMWRVMLRMRWFIAKMALIAIAVPALHFFLRSRSLALHALLAQPAPDLHEAAPISHYLLIGTATAIAFALTAIILGRIKPRLGQNYVH